MNREKWLTKAVKDMEFLIELHGFSLPDKWRISSGWWKGSKNALGVAIDASVSADEETHHIYVSPEVGVEQPLDLMGVILHEMVHLAVGTDQGHGGEFKRLAKLIGLEGRMTSCTVVEGTALADQVLIIYNNIGWEYPHKTITFEEEERKPRVNNFLFYVSENDPKYVVRIHKEFAEFPPKDYLGQEMVLQD